MSETLRKALRSVFGWTCSYLGDELFDVCAGSYVAQNPCTLRAVHCYGAGFSNWLGHLLADHPLVAELASLEWAMGADYDACIDAAPAAASAPLTLHPTARVLPLSWNTVDVWHSLKRGEAPPEAVPLPAPAHWLVWQRDGRPQLRLLEELEAEALRRFRPGASASGDYLHQWLAQGVLVES